jgi:transcriptional regulator with PAS, ATPase and Fis domain
MNDLKQVVHNMMKGVSNPLNNMDETSLQNTDQLFRAENNFSVLPTNRDLTVHNPIIVSDKNAYAQPIFVEESLSLQDKEIDMIKKALKKHKGKRKYASKELGISERTLYRKINEYHIED